MCSNGVKGIAKVLPGSMDAITFEIIAPRCVDEQIVDIIQNTNFTSKYALIYVIKPPYDISGILAFMHQNGHSIVN